MEITSVNNEKIKNIKKLYNKKDRIKENKYIIEGIKIVEEAYLAKQNFVNIIICMEIYNNVGIDKSVTDKLIKELENKIIYVSENVFNSLSDTVTPQGIMAVLEINENNNECADDILFLDRIQDTGNIGTILRTARAFGFNTVILNKGCGDIYNSKVIRSAMGNIFKLNIIILEDLGIDVLYELKEKGFFIYVTTLEHSKSIYSINFNKKKVIIMGNEANGVCGELIELSNENMTIPMSDNTESLNVGVATGIVLAELRRKGE